MGIFGFDMGIFMSFILTLIRVSLLVFLLPFYGGDSLPMPVKAALAIVLTLCIWPAIGFASTAFPASLLQIIIMMIGEVLLGLLMGLMVHCIFAGIQFGGEMMGTQMGFTMISLADPNGGDQMVITSYLMYMVSMMVFLGLDGHLHLLGALIESFKYVEPGALLLSGRLTADIISFSGTIFVIACKVAGPVVASLFLVELGLGLMAKVAPQMNILMMGMPLKIGVGFFFMSIVFSSMSLYMEEIIVGLRPMFINVLKMAG